MGRAAGFAVGAVAVVLLVYWELAWVRPTLTPLAGDGYDELYGPVSFFRWPVDIALILMAFVGIAMLLWPLRRESKT